MRLDYQGELTIPAPLAEVWAFLTDPQRVSCCVPDLHQLEVHDGQRFDAVVRVGVGPVRGPFRLQVQMSRDEDEKTASLHIRGFGMGSGVELSSSMKLEPQGDGETLMRWRAEGSVSGPLASVGGRLLDAQARKTIEQIFENVRRAFAAPAPAAEA